MIVFENNNDLEPYKKLRDLYDLALSKNQMNIEAILIASFSHEDNEVDSRFVNLKYVNNEKFIFFTNYESPKSKQFESHSQISAVIYWNKVDIQIRMKAKILKLDSIHSDEHFKKRKKEKNALAISSKQSQPIDSYENVEKDFAEVMKVRISDHGVTSNRRVTGGEFLGFRNNLQRILEVAKSWNEEYTAEWGADNDYTL